MIANQIQSYKQPEKLQLSQSFKQNDNIRQHPIENNIILKDDVEIDIKNNDSFQPKSLSSFQEIPLEIQKDNTGDMHYVHTIKMKPQNLDILDNDFSRNWVTVKLIEMGYDKQEFEEKLNEMRFCFEDKEGIVTKLVQEIEKQYQDRTSSNGQIISNPTEIKQPELSLQEISKSTKQISKSRSYSRKNHQDNQSVSIPEMNQIEIYDQKSELFLEIEQEEELMNTKIHRQIKKKPSTQSQLSRRKTTKKIVGECTICFYDIYEDQQLIRSCTHQFCKTCVIDYLEIQINQSKVLKICCPMDGCTEQFNEEEIKNIINENMYAKYLKFKTRIKLQQNPNIKFCVNANCESYVERQNSNQKKLTCHDCKTEFCFDCTYNWHEGRTCEQVLDEQFKQYQNNNLIQLCPKCKSRTEKASGCNHISCSVCQHEWCWLCRGKYAHGHFSPLNIFGCPGLQSGSYTKKNWPTIKIYLYRFSQLIILLLLLCLSPIFLFCLVASYPTRRYLRKKNKMCCSTFKFFIISTLLFILGICLFPISFIFWLHDIIVTCIKFRRGRAQRQRPQQNRVNFNRNILPQNRQLNNQAVQRIVINCIPEQ